MKNKCLRLILLLQLTSPLTSMAVEKTLDADSQYLSHSAKTLKQLDSQRLLNEKAEAFGLITGHYESTLLVVEKCGEYPYLKTESEETTKLYISNNHELFLKVVSTFEKSLAKEQGQEELLKFQKQLADTLESDKINHSQEIQETASSEEKCSVILSNLRRGYWDINVKRASAVKLILGNRNPEITQSTLKPNAAKKPIPVGSKFAWRSLKLGMDDSVVKQILGEPDKVNVGTDLAKWSYLNDGEVLFDSQSMKLKAWYEPSFNKVEVTKIPNSPYTSSLTDYAGELKRKKELEKNKSSYNTILKKIGLDSSK